MKKVHGAAEGRERECICFVHVRYPYLLLKDIKFTELVHGYVQLILPNG